MSRERGFSMAEILTTIVVLAAIAMLAAPIFSKGKAQAEASQAIAYLRTVRTAQRMYYAKNGAYSCRTATTECDSATKIKSVLGVEIPTGNYSYAVTATATTFTATATGNGNTITLTQAGEWAGYTPLPTN